MAAKWLKAEPDHTVICSGLTDWKVEAEQAAATGQLLLLIGAPDREFIERLKKKYGLECQMEAAGNRLLLWNSKVTGIPCLDEAELQTPQA